MNVIEDIRKEFTYNLNNIIKYLPIVVPADETDKKAIAIGSDMLECLINDINSPAISDALDVDRLVQDWERISELFAGINSMQVQRAIDEIVSMYDQDEQDEGDDDESE